MVLGALVLSPLSDFHAAMPSQLQQGSTAVSCLLAIVSVVACLAVIAHLAAPPGKQPVVNQAGAAADAPSSNDISASMAMALAGEPADEISDPTSQSVWFMQVSGQKIGPMTCDLLRERLSKGTLSSTAKVWRVGLEEWMPVTEMEEFRSFVAPSRMSTAGRSAWLRLPIPRLGRSIPFAVAATGLALVLALAMTRRGSVPYVSVSGSVKYDDGTLLPVDSLAVRFHSLVRVRDAQTLPAAGTAVVDTKTGTFSSASTSFFRRGVLQGLHKITLHMPDGTEIDPSIVGKDYCDVQTTVLRVHTKNSPFTIRVQRP